MSTLGKLRFRAGVLAAITFVSVLGGVARRGLEHGVRLEPLEGDRSAYAEILARDQHAILPSKDSGGRRQLWRPRPESADPYRLVTAQVLGPWLGVVGDVAHGWVAFFQSGSGAAHCWPVSARGPPTLPA